MTKYRYYWVVDAYNLQIRRCECLASVWDHHVKLRTSENEFDHRNEAVAHLIKMMEYDRKRALHRARQCRAAIIKYGGRQRYGK